MRLAVSAIGIVAAITGFQASAADLVVSKAAPAVVVAAPVTVVVVPPRRLLTTYMASYPFGVLREDYTPLGAPGVSKRDYFGRPTRYAVLHSSPRRAFKKTRVVLRTRY